MKLNWDPRFTVLAFLVSFCIYAITSPAFGRSPWMWVASFASCIITDFLLTWWLKKKIEFPLSGLISSMGTLLLVDSPYVAAYLIVGFISIVAKHFIKVDGRHIFNPNNFGLVIAILYFSDLVTVQAGRWGGSLWILSLVLMLGLLATYHAGRFWLSFSYILFFIVGVFVRAMILGLSPWALAIPMTGASFFLFTFFMMTDPKTSPQTVPAQFLFSFVLASLDAYLRYQQYKFAPFVALFVICSLMPLLRYFEQSRIQKYETA